MLVQITWECTPPYLSTGISNLLQPAQVEVVLGQPSTYLASWLQPEDYKMCEKVRHHVVFIESHTYSRAGGHFLVCGHWADSRQNRFRGAIQLMFRITMEAA